MSSNSDGSLTVVFTDLDNCMLQSIPRIGSNPAAVASLARDGSPQGGMSGQQVALWRWLEAADLIVPTTGRTPEQLKRVTLEFHGPSVCLQGAVILDSTRSVDASWWAKIHAQSQVCRAELQTLMQRLGTLCSGHGVQIQSVSHDGMPLFLTLRSLPKGSDVVWRNVDLAVRSALAEQAAYRNWSVRQDTRRLHVLPPHIGKEHAVQHLLNVLNPTLSMGVGHSDADRPFMVRCDAFIEVNANIAPGQN